MWGLVVQAIRFVSFAGHDGSKSLGANQHLTTALQPARRDQHESNNTGAA